MRNARLLITILAATLLTAQPAAARVGIYVTLVGEEAKQKYGEIQLAGFGIGPVEPGSDERKCVVYLGSTIAEQGRKKGE